MITITEKAAAEAKRIIEQENLGEDYFLRAGVIGGGCSGLSYTLGFDKNQTEGDVAEEQHGLKIVMDNKSNLYLQEATLDYNDSLMGGGFKFSNPQAKTTCGCGSSFS